jgi:hypothetical protein
VSSSALDLDVAAAVSECPEGQLKQGFHTTLAALGYRARLWLACSWVALTSLGALDQLPGMR